MRWRLLVFAALLAALVFALPKGVWVAQRPSLTVLGGAEDEHAERIIKQGAQDAAAELNLGLQYITAQDLEDSEYYSGAVFTSDSAANLIAWFMFDTAPIFAAIENAAADNPVYAGILTTESSLPSAKRFLSDFLHHSRFFKDEDGAPRVLSAVRGYEPWEREPKDEDDEPLAPHLIVEIRCVSSREELNAAITELLALPGPFGLFCASERITAVLLEQTNSGADFARPGGPAAHVYVFGTGADAATVEAVRAGYIAGSRAADYYKLGMLAFEGALREHRGQPKRALSAGYLYYDALRMDNEDIARLLGT
jgi:hypothetical protein